MSRDRELRALVELAEAQGWTVTPTRKSHLRFASPDGVHLVIASGTASDRRATKNLRAQLRRAGLVTTAP